MKIIRQPDEMRALCCDFRKAGRTVGLVPTMGALHEGHLSLVQMSRKLCGATVMSIFVNPIQFGPAEDYQKYPRPFESDCEKAEEAGCDAVFAPEQGAMYPPDYSSYVELERITGTLCGASRPGHFRGVATVVLKFFNIVRPQVALFGQKDAQQVVVIKRMVADLNVPVKIAVSPIVREKSGLAMSSRNVYLTAEERLQSSLIYKGLLAASNLFDKGERVAQNLKAAIGEVLGAATLVSPEYIEIVNTLTLEPIEAILGQGHVLIAIAVRMKTSKTRLIDNIVLGGEL
jgi:pantoate--beta-alanine ligase